MAEEERKISKYSSGVNILLRLDNLWKDANVHSRSGKYSKWNEDLDVIWRELARDLDDIDYNEKEKVKNGFDSELVKLGGFNDGGHNSFDDIDPKIPENRAKQYRILNNKELFLRRLEGTLGKGTTWDDDDEDGYD